MGGKKRCRYWIWIVRNGEKKCILVRKKEPIILNFLNFAQNHIQSLPQNAASDDKAATNVSSSPMWRVSTVNKGYQHLNDDESASIKSTVSCNLVFQFYFGSQFFIVFPLSIGRWIQRPTNQTPFESLGKDSKILFRPRNDWIHWNTNEQRTMHLLAIMDSLTSLMIRRWNWF